MTTEIVGSVQTLGLSSMGLIIFALVAVVLIDIARGDVKVLPKWVWAVAVVLAFPLGPVVYLLFGRVSRRGARVPQPGE
ncbi:PLD nuclease N-terminal domain-containing protein [Demequina flava]|uniref:PLD nuclease N-terminal domain-containing protein n=1 Tax=Demequina flava TaxID=1095025 RepID=UPI000784B5E3|nr:PLD nuclease N-terminal domain-containing protein [Demequina flava]